jgi:hypothetical protein
MKELSTVDEALSLIGFSKQEIARVKKNEVVQSKLDCLTDRELAAGFAFKVKLSADDVESIFLESKSKEETDPTIQQMGFADEEGNMDFSKVKLLPSNTASEMVKAYVNAKPGDGLNLSQEEMDLFHTLGKSASQDQVEATLRQVLTARFNEYRQKGLEGISPYCRGKGGKNYEPGKELLEKTSKSKQLKKFAPAFYKYITDYPNSKPEDSVQESFGWINFNLEGKPTIALFHKLTQKQGNEFFMMQRQFYVSRGHNSVQAVGGATTVEEDETLVYLSSRTSTDLVSGFGGAVKRAMGSNIMGGRIAENMERYRSAVEKKA